MDREEMIEKNRRLTRNIKEYDNSSPRKKNRYRSNNFSSSKKLCISCREVEPLRFFIENGLEKSICYYCRETKICSICGKTKNLRKFPNNGKYTIYCSQCETIKRCPACGKKKKRMEFINNNIEHDECVTCEKQVVSMDVDKKSKPLSQTKPKKVESMQQTKQKYTPQSSTKNTYSKKTLGKVESRQNTKQKYTPQASSETSSPNNTILAIVAIVLILGILLFLLINPLVFLKLFFILF